MTEVVLLLLIDFHQISLCFLLLVLVACLLRDMFQDFSTQNLLLQGKKYLNPLALVLLYMSISLACDLFFAYNLVLNAL